ncbi:hypothetical protein WOLCODRAFT_63085 [Wolfiporia cocos MD-104 SS10]|uniref:Uncharacterized protein n=1 Tax=Wolfiporia cocos (strain MD-104) TaxID=742152 RepID=A0A2H3IWK2_WOLCO|nr:hypothetical protein WOLCODRAFT_63085 [Wolfiporia cocos MD-104 SS10]
MRITFWFAGVYGPLYLSSQMIMDYWTSHDERVQGNVPCVMAENTPHAGS